MGFAVSSQPSHGLTVIRDGGKKIPILPRSYRVTSRAGKGFEVIKRGKLKGIVQPEIEVPEFLNPDAPKNGASGKKKKKK